MKDGFGYVDTAKTKKSKDLEDRLMKKIYFKLLLVWLVTGMLTGMLMIGFSMPMAVASESIYEYYDGTFLFDDGTMITVIHASPGSIVTVAGGPNKCEEALKLKEELVLQVLHSNINATKVQSLPKDGLVTESLFRDRQIMSFDSSAAPASFGNGSVALTQQGVIIRDFPDAWTVTMSCSGTTQTLWSGTQPQFNSDQIKLNESWRFHGASITLNIPPGVGFSGSSETVSWSAHDSSGTQWRMSHDYSGVGARSNVALISMTKSGTASHRFQGWRWISVADSTNINFGIY